MTKKTNNSNINNLLCDNQGRQYFFKNAKSYGYLINDEQLQNKIITKKDHISLSLNVDTEYTQPLCIKPEKITLEMLLKNPNRHLVQVDAIDQILNFFPDLQNFNYMASEKDLKINGNSLKKLQHVKAGRTLQLTTQFKHVLYNDSEILVNPEIKKVYEENIKDEQYLYPYYDSKGCQFIDFLKLKGFKDIAIDRKEDKSTMKKLPTLTMKLYGYYMMADLCKIFGGVYLEDIKKAILKGKISLKRRLAASGMLKAWYPSWIITLNNIQYKVAIELNDFGGIHGISTYEQVLTNLGLATDDKNLLNDIKDNMLLAMIARPAEFKKYALGDLNIYEVAVAHNDLLKVIWEERNVARYFVESKLTTGAYTNDLQEAILFKFLDYSPEEIQEIIEEYNKHRKKPVSKLSIREILKQVTYTACPQYMRGYINVHMQDDADYKKHVGSKTMGGRCNINRLLATSIASRDYSLCDIDIAGAYSTTYNSLDYYFGHPVILGFSKHKVTLREFLKFYKKSLIKRGYKLVVETKESLTIEQDIFPSWTNITVKRDKIKTASIDDVYSHLLTEDDRLNDYQMYQGVDLESTNTDIFTTELHNSSITYDDINFMFTQAKPEQREEWLDKIYMQSAIFYPAEMECKNVAEFKRKVREHNLHSTFKYTKEMPHSKIDNKCLNKGNCWIGVNFGQLIGEHIKIARAKYKILNPSLATLFKLIGNTLYGINVSRHFISSNIVLAANITSMCRMAMWYIEKALNIHQTITDGGIFDLNKVPHLITKSIDTKCLVRAYQSTDRELANNDKWSTKPITKDYVKISYDQKKGWFFDNAYYSKENSDALYKKINRLTMKHVQKIFSKNSLLNDTYKDVRLNSNNEIEHIYKKGLYDFEVKALTNEASFHGAANYYYNDVNKGEEKFKMRGFESKKSVVAYFLEDKKTLKTDENFYSSTKSIEMFLKNIKDDPEHVKLLPPYVKPTMLKINQYKQQYKRTFQYSNAIPGDDYYELITIPIFTLRFKFKGLEQKKAWMRYGASLKNRFGGLSYEVFFMNEDGTCNYKKMLEYIDDLISKGISDPKKIFDPHNHLGRNMKNIHVLNRVEIMGQIKNALRMLNVGITQYCNESFDIVEQKMAA